MLKFILQSFLVGYAIQPYLQSGYKVLGFILREVFVGFKGFWGFFFFFALLNGDKIGFLGLVLGFIRVCTFGVENLS